MIKQMNLLFLIAIIFSKRLKNGFSFNYESFLVLNINHGDMPITLFNYGNEDTSLPMRLSKIDNTSLPFQTFNVRYNNTKFFWLSPELDSSYGSMFTNKFLIARKKPFRANLRLKSARNGTDTKLYHIVAGEECLTVGSKVTKGGLEYYKLEFRKCSQGNKDQEFMFIPKLIGIQWLSTPVEHHASKTEIRRSYTTLTQILEDIDDNKEPTN